MIRPRDILGMNARNLRYLRPSNPRSAVRLADSKLKTKLILAEAKIPTPKVFGMFKHAREIDKFNWENLPENVVLKPNRGFGGEGIVVFSKKEKDSDGKPVWITNDGERWPIDDMRRHIINILDGDFSLQNIPDTAFFEEKIVTHRVMRRYTYKGLPDARVIVFNKVPVIAMLRLPTKWSKGKANLAQGAIGVGIDMATGQTTTAAIKKPVHKAVFKHPDTLQDLRGLVVPYWNEILEMAIHCQEATKIGYLGADIAIDEKYGPLILELNARPGLEIQNVNLVPLGARLRRLEGLKIRTLEKGVRLAKELFGGGGEKKVDELISKTVIGTEEILEIIAPDGQRHRILGRIDTGEGLTVVDSSLSQKLGLSSAPTELNDGLEKKHHRLVNLVFYLAGEKIKTKTVLADRTDHRHLIVIGRRDLQPFLIDTSRREHPEKAEKLDYQKVDQVLVEVSRKIPLLSALTPVNFEMEREKFFAQENYSPQFIYKKPSNSELDLLRSRLEIFPLENDYSILGKIFYHKQQELIKKIETIRAIGTESFTAQSLDLYGEPTGKLVDLAEKNYQNKIITETNGVYLKQSEVIALLSKKLNRAEIPHKIVVVKDLSARITVKTLEKSILINLRSGALFKHSDLIGTIAHEIETHAYRYANGMLQPFKIFSEGLGGYLATEEGLAIYSKEQAYKNPRKFITRALGVLAVHWALTASFYEIYQRLRAKGVLPKTAFSITYRAKRGLADTSRPGAFTRDYLYLKGVLEIEKYIDQGFDPKKLYVGKIGIADLPAISKLSGMKEPKYLPEWLTKK